LRQHAGFPRRFVLWCYFEVNPNWVTHTAWCVLICLLIFIFLIQESQLPCMMDPTLNLTLSDLLTPTKKVQLAKSEMKRYIVIFTVNIS